jgi:type IV secretory pathway ATPase VirB11/archaellum biosynthesis ATPase
MELVVEDLEAEPKPSPETVQKHLEAILASMDEYAKFLRDLQREAAIQEKSGQGLGQVRNWLRNPIPRISER